MTVRVIWDVASAVPGAVERDISDEAAMLAVEAALAHGGRAGLAVDVIFVSDAALIDLHQRFHGDSSATDVIAFDLEDGSDGPGAEVYVSVECGRRVAAERGVRVERELALYLVHGALHLAGYDDHSGEDRSTMRRAEVDVLLALGYERDDLPHDR